MSLCTAASVKQLCLQQMHKARIINNKHAVVFTKEGKVLGKVLRQEKGHTVRKFFRVSEQKPVSVM